MTGVCVSCGHAGAYPGGRGMRLADMRCRRCGGSLKAPPHKPRAMSFAQWTELERALELAELQAAVSTWRARQNAPDPPAHLDVRWRGGFESDGPGRQRPSDRYEVVDVRCGDVLFQGTRSRCRQVICARLADDLGRDVACV